MLIPVILCGGSGTRLWPASTKNKPKQFLNLIGQRKPTLLANTINRVAFSNVNKIIFSTTAHHFNELSHELENIKYDNEIIVEPSGKNTAPSILSAAICAYGINEDAILCCMPSDHKIGNIDNWSKTIEKACKLAEEGSITIVGVKPSFPSTQYGYIKVKNSGSELNVSTFKEKPDLATAKKFLEEGNWLWNMGVVVVKAKTLIDKSEQICPEIIDKVYNAFHLAKKLHSKTILDQEAWNRVEEISFDHAFLENFSTLKCIKFEGSWSDLGDWEAVLKEMESDKNGNILSNNERLVNCINTAVWSDKASPVVLGLGLENILVASTKNGILIADRSSTHSLKDAMTMINEVGDNSSSKTHIDEDDNMAVSHIQDVEGVEINKLTIEPGTTLDLSSSSSSSRSITCISGKGLAIGSTSSTKLQTAKTSYFAKNTLQKIENNSSQYLILIECIFNERILN